DRVDFARLHGIGERKGFHAIGRRGFLGRLRVGVDHGGKRADLRKIARQIPAPISITDMRNRNHLKSSSPCWRLEYGQYLHWRGGSDVLERRASNWTHKGRSNALNKHWNSPETGFHFLML